MAAQSEQCLTDNSPANCRPIELITENGFSIVRFDEIDGASVSSFGQYRFLVRSPSNDECEIVVGIAHEAVIEITLRSNGRISSKSSYWICCAEHHLADYLWENDDYPPNATLCVELLTPHDLNLARRWGTTSTPI